MKRPRIVMVGGGSYSWAPRIVKDLMLTPSLRDAEFVLYDINRRAADRVAGALAHVQAEVGGESKVIPTDRRAKAFNGADYFVITISTGGLKSMAHDIAIPERYGIYHTVGDTSGPGGWARLVRNFGVIKKLAEDMNRHAPGAMVLNYTNPMSTLTDVLSRVCEGPVVGLCHGLFENLRFLKDFYRLKSEDELSVDYAGLNHFVWLTKIRTRRRDLLADLRRRLRRQSLTDLLAEAHADVMGFKSDRELATELFRLTGVMPYLGDRHTCEFLPGYITSRKNMKRYRISRTPIKARVAGFKRREANVAKWAKKGLPDGFVTRSRETAADIISAHFESRSFIDVGNVPNRGQVRGLPEGTVVETAVRVDANGFSPIVAGPLPEVVLGMLEPYARVFRMGVDACFRGDRELALGALRLDPVTSHLNGAEVREMGTKLLRAHKKFIRCFKV